MTTTTTSYGTWTTRVEPYSASFGQSVYESLGDAAPDFDVDGLIQAYRDAINKALPQNVSLVGDEFIGPYYAQDQKFDGYAHDADDSLDIKAIVESIDFWALAEHYDRSA